MDVTQKAMLNLTILTFYLIMVCYALESPLGAIPSPELQLKSSDSKDTKPSSGQGSGNSKTVMEGHDDYTPIGFAHAFIASLSVIVVSEIGDKTFFIAAIMAMRHSRCIVFAGAMSALIVMTVLSSALGFATTVIPRVYTHYLSIALFVIFGLRMLREAYTMSPDEGMEEYEEVQKSLNKKDIQGDGNNVSDMEGGIRIEISTTRTLRGRLGAFLSRAFLQSFTLTFLGEWGDRSQLSTIILAARENVVGVTLGALVGHSGCTLLAVMGGRMVAQRISVRTVTLIGGIVFLVFALSAIVMGPGKEELDL